MSNGKYTIKKKEFSGIEITSMVIENSEGKQKKMPMADVVRLARVDKLDNVRVKFNYVNSDYTLIFDESLSNIEDTDRSGGVHLVLTARIIENDKCIGYKALNDKNKTYKLSIEKVWELAEKGSVKDVKACINGSTKVLKSIGDIKLKDLPVIYSN